MHILIKKKLFVLTTVFSLFLHLACSGGDIKGKKLNSVCFLKDVGLPLKSQLESVTHDSIFAGKKLKACWEYYDDQTFVPASCSKVGGQALDFCPQISKLMRCKTKNPNVKVLLYEGWSDCEQTRQFSLGLSD